MAYSPHSFRVIDGLIPTRGANLTADLTLPTEPVGVVIFAHGSGSGRTSPRNQAVAQILNASHIATVLFDLLTPAEDTTYSNRFDIELLTWRLVRAVEWVREHPFIPEVPVGLFGASTGAAAAIKAATLLGTSVSAVVSRGGRPDLAGDSLAQLRVPSLFIVGGNDPEVEALNRKALTRMRCEKQISIVPGAGHLFEEGQSLDIVAGLAAGWFLRHFQERAEGERRMHQSPRPEHPIP
jgi:putative phosphoribosyl transferase